jgi:hypothetical protein
MYNVPRVLLESSYGESTHHLAELQIFLFRDSDNRVAEPFFNPPLQNLS